MKDETCIFCKIAAGEIPSKTLQEDETCRVFLDLGPATRGHALVVPKEHYPDLFAVPQEEHARIMATAKQAGARLVERLGADGLNLVQNNGEAAGQTVAHFHVHLIPRYQGDGQTIGWKPGELTDEEAASILERWAGN